MKCLRIGYHKTRLAVLVRFVNYIVTLIMGALGFNLTLYPIVPGDASRIRKYKFLFGILSLATVVLVVVQHGTGSVNCGLRGLV